MTRLRYFAPLVAAGAMLALTSGAQAQQLTDGVQTTPFTGNVISLPTDANPSGDIGDPTGATETQINFETNHDFQYGAFVPTAEDTNGDGHISAEEAAQAAEVPLLGRTYSFTEVNILDVNLNSIPGGNANVSPVYNSCEVNLLVPVSDTGTAADTGFVGNCATLDANSTLNMTGGLVGTLSTINGVVNISGGRLGNTSMISGTVNVTGAGGISSNATVLSGGVVNLMSDDAIIFPTVFEPGSTLNVDSGTVNPGSNIGGVANVTGGRFTNDTNVSGTFNISGEATVSSGSFIRSGGTINASGDVTLFGLTIEAGSTLNLTDNVSFRNSTIEGVVNMDGGTAAFSYVVQNGGVFNLMDGEIGTGALDIRDGGTVNHSGGNLGFNTDVESGGVLNISGGSFGASIAFADLDVAGGGTVNFIGTAFAIDGTSINLVEGTPTIITNRGVLTGTLADGQTIEFNLNAAGNDSFAAGSTISVALPATTVLLGDVNLDGIVNFLDISPFIQRLSNQEPQAEADVNQDGVVSFLDISPFIMILTAAGS